MARLPFVGTVVSVLQYSTSLMVLYCTDLTTVYSRMKDSSLYRRRPHPTRVKDFSCVCQYGQDASSTLVQGHFLGLPPAEYRVKVGTAAESISALSYRCTSRVKNFTVKSRKSGRVTLSSCVCVSCMKSGLSTFMDGYQHGQDGDEITITVWTILFTIVALALATAFQRYINTGRARARGTLLDEVVEQGTLLHEDAADDYSDADEAEAEEEAAAEAEERPAAAALARDRQAVTSKLRDRATSQIPPEEMSKFSYGLYLRCQARLQVRVERRNSWHFPMSYCLTWAVTCSLLTYQLRSAYAKPAGDCAPA